MLDAAEHSLTGPRGGGPGVLTAIPTNQYGTHSSSSSASHHSRRYEDPAPRAAPAAAYYDPGHGQQWTPREEEFARQLRVCMKEIAELRSELSAEREGRHHLQQLIAKRSKEEVMVEVHTIHNQMRQDLREIEVSVQQRLTDSETTRAVDRRKVDDALRYLKSQERSQFDVAEQYREQLEDMRQRVDSCVAGTNTIRTEVTHQLESEKGRMEHRLDVELERYAEMHRQHQQALSETRNSVSREVQEVSRTVQSLVETTWDDRIKSVQKMIAENLSKYNRVQEQQAEAVSTLSGQVSNYLRESKRDLSQSTAELRDRLAMLEGNAPLLAAQMDRVSRKADTSVESNSKLSALVDVLREAADKAAAQAVRSSERAQKVEDTFADRDARILSLESQAAALAGFDRLRNDLDATKRAVQRIEGNTDTIRQVADRCERVVEDMQRSVDAAADRGNAIETKAVRAISRLETNDGKIAALIEQTHKIDELTDRMRSDMEQAAQMREALRSKFDTLDHRLAAHVEGTRGQLSDYQQDLRNLETRLATTEEHHHREQSQAQGAKLEKLEKKLQRLEALSSNTSGNLSDLQSAVDATRDIADKANKKYEAVNQNIARNAAEAEKKLSEHQSALAGLDATVRAVRAAVGGNDESINRIAGDMNQRFADVDRRLGRLSVTNAGGGVASGGAAQGIAEQTAAELDTLRRRVDGIDRRVGQVERNVRQGAISGADSGIHAAASTHEAPQVQSTGVYPNTAGSPVRQPLFTGQATPEPKQQPKQQQQQHAQTKTTTQVVVGGEDSASAWAATKEGSVGKSDSTSVVSSVHLQCTAPKPSQTNFDSDDEADTIVSAPATGTAGRPPLGGTGANTPTGKSAGAASKPSPGLPVLQKTAFDTSDSDVGGKGAKQPPAKADSVRSGTSPLAQTFGAAVESEELSHDGPQQATSPSPRLRKTAYSSSDNDSPNRSFSGVGAPTPAAKVASPMRTNNPFDEKTDSDASFELAQTRDQQQLEGQIPAAAVSPTHSSDAETRELVKQKLASSGSNPFLKDDLDDPQPPAKAEPTKTSAPPATTTIPAPATDTSSKTTPRPKMGGWADPSPGGMTTSDEDIAIPTGHRSAKVYISTTGDSSEGASPQGTNVAARVAAAKSGEDTERTKKYTSVAKAAAKKTYDEFDDDSDGADEEIEEFEVGSRHSHHSSRSRGSKKSAATGSSQGLDNISLSITPTTKSHATTKDKTKPKSGSGSGKAVDFDESSDDGGGDDDEGTIDDDALAAMM